MWNEQKNSVSSNLNIISGCFISDGLVSNQFQINPWAVRLFGKSGKFYFLLAPLRMDEAYHIRREGYLLKGSDGQYPVDH